VSADIVGVRAQAPGAGDLWVHAWTVALTELEVAVDEAEAMLHRLPATSEISAQRWAPPAGLGPLPASLQARAQALLDRHVEVTRQTAEAIVQTRRHLNAVAQMRSFAVSTPVYVDTCV
jgi:hypothetical protein